MDRSRRGLAGGRVARFAKVQETTVTCRVEGEGRIAWISFFDVSQMINSDKESQE
jgi:hypothetical protein